ncbi:hypothetical protein [Alkalinema sp. FACHB-956]|uniref:hypothetical protein n=1 Tax=Alkalinema sp. FACHB-956 TaxID=2692768 RepID=UPI001685CF8A|nr:hypothetical protein [Alkalinema sp. FACHB-956]MBD2329876.1 hypothetical protein [Alkalinema sp. FACHB-956]
MTFLTRSILQTSLLLLGFTLPLSLQISLPGSRSAALAQPASDAMRAATIKAFTTYRKDKVEIEGNKQRSTSEQLAARRDTLMLIDRKGIAPELKEFFDLLLTEWDKSIEVYTQLEREDQNLSNSLSMLPGSNDFLTNTFVQTMFNRPIAQSANNAFAQRWLPSLYSIQSESTLRQLKLLNQLSQKYEYPFLDAVYGRVPAQDVACNSRATTTTLDIPGNSNQAIASVQVCKGDYISFLAKGSVLLGKWVGASGPAGQSDGGTMYNKVSAFPFGALLVQVGEGKWAMGGYTNSFFAENSGTINFLINDGKTSDNRGAYQVDVTVYPRTSFMGR